MKKKIRVCKWLVIGITSIGVIIMAVILTMYYSHYVQVESIINDYKQSIEQLQESQSGKTDSGSNRQPGNIDKYKTDYDTDTRERSRSDGVILFFN